MGKKRIWVSLIVIMVLSLLLSGCGRKPKEEGRYVEYPLRTAVLIEGEYNVNYLNVGIGMGCWQGIDQKFKQVTVARVFGCEDGAKLRDYGAGANPRYTICAPKGWVHGE